MAMLIPNEGEIQLLTDLLSGGSLENWSLRLFKADITPAETDTAATYTAQEATFSSYTAKTLTRSVSGSTWSTPVSQAPSGSWSAEAACAYSAYGSSPQSWTCGATGNTIYGYFITGATSGKLIGVEKFTTARTLVSGDTLSLTPVFESA